MSSVDRDPKVDSRSPKVSDYDRFSAGLVASIVILGFLVLSLAMVWLFGNQQARGFTPTLRPFPIENPDESGLEIELDEVVGGSSSTELVSLLESVENSVSQKRADLGSPGKGDSLPGTPKVSWISLVSRSASSHPKRMKFGESQNSLPAQRSLLQTGPVRSCLTISRIQSRL